MKRTALILTLSVFGVLSVAPAPRVSAQEAKTITETAVAAGKFETLVAAVTAAGLAETLSGEGPFTVLAPTDDAFAKLPEGTVETLLKPENKKKLIAILKLHVAPGKLTSDMAQPGGEFPNGSGVPHTVEMNGDQISVGGAKVVTADILCSNGVIHIIDSVILPTVAVDPKQLVGSWTYAKAVKNGEEKTGDQLAGQTVEITETTWTLGGEAKFVMDYSIDSKASPNKIKFTMTESPFGAGMTTGGVIKMVGEQLVVAYSAQGGDAPEGFVSKEGSGVHLFYLTKKK